MITILLGFIVMLGIVIAMSVGVLLGRKPISGSCGGLSALGMKESCDICGGNDEECEKEQIRQQEKQAAKLAYEVGAKSESEQQ